MFRYHVYLDKHATDPVAGFGFKFVAEHFAHNNDGFVYDTESKQWLS